MNKVSSRSRTSTKKTTRSKTKSSSSKTKSSSSKTKSSSSKTKINKNNVSKNVYREHQEDVIKNYADNKGLILYHSVGSGKTITALGIYKQVVKVKPELKLVIVCEPYIKYRWQADISFLNIDKNNVKYYTYTSPQLEEVNLKQSILIIDEAHNITPLMQDKRNNKTINNLLTCYKVICLTATPIRYSIADISYLLNFTAKKTILPYNPDEFRHKFMVMNKLKRALFGNIYPYISVLVPYAITLVNTEDNAIYKQMATYILSIIMLSSLAAMSTESFFKLDAAKISKYMKRYVSFYSVKDDNKYYPKINSVYHNYAYSTEQYDLILKYSTKEFSPYLLRVFKDINQTKPAKNSQGIVDPRDILNAYANYNDPYLYLDNLTVIGNVGESDKINGLFDFIEKNAKSKHVVYSKFRNFGMDLAKKEMKKRGITFEVLSKEIPQAKFTKIVEDFKTNTTSVILLDPESTEGFELYGIHHFHLMEPVNDYTLLTQVKGRAYRYNSHKHLPESERTLTYHTWYCDLPQYKNLLYEGLRYKSVLIFIKENLLAPFYREKSKRMDYNRSPDEIAISNIQMMDTNLVDINNQFIK